MIRLGEILAAVQKDGSRAGQPSTTFARAETGSSKASLAIPERGIELATFQRGLLIDANDLVILLTELSSMFGADYFDKNALEHKRALMVFVKAQERKCTKAEFRSMLDRFIETQRFDNWKPADFFEYKRPRVYPHSWLTARIKEDRHHREQIGCYEHPETKQPVWGWRSELDGVLSEFVSEQRRTKSVRDELPLADDSVDWRKLIASGALNRQFLDPSKGRSMSSE